MENAVSKILLNIISQTQTLNISTWQLVPLEIYRYAKVQRTLCCDHNVHMYANEATVWPYMVNITKMSMKGIVMMQDWKISPKLSTHKKKRKRKKEIYFALQALSLKCKVMSPRFHWTQLIQMPSHMPFLCVAVICCLGQTAYMCIIEEKHNHWGHWHSEKNWGYLMIPLALLETTCFDVGCDSTVMVSARGKPTLMMTDWRCNPASWKRQSSSEDCHAQQALTATVARLTALWGTKQVVLRLFLAITGCSVSHTQGCSVSPDVSYTGGHTLSYMQGWYRVVEYLLSIH